MSQASVDLSVGRSVGRSGARSVGVSVGRSVDRSVGRSMDRSVGGSLGIFSFFKDIPRDARKGRFPPFGFVSREFRLCAPVLALFLEVFDLTDVAARVSDLSLRTPRTRQDAPTGRPANN